MNRFAPFALALLGGALVALSIPPYSLWPLGILGIACYFVAAERAAARASTQFVVGAVFAWAWLAPGMGWMWQLVPGGFVVAPLLFAVWHGIASIVASRLAPHSHHQSTRLLVRAATHSLIECLRFYAPFGGVPLASTALGVADTRLAGLARVAGALGVSLWLFVAAAVVAGLWLGRREFGWRPRRGALVTIAVLVGMQALAVFAPRGDDSGRTMRIAAVQGGGPQAVLAVDSNPRDVIARHFAATRLLDADDKIDLVVWPENAIDVRDFATSQVRNDIAAEAQRSVPRLPSASPKTRATTSPMRRSWCRRPRRNPPKRNPTHLRAAVTTKCCACRTANTSRCAGCSNHSVRQSTAFRATP